MPCYSFINPFPPHYRTPECRLHISWIFRQIFVDFHILSHSWAEWPHSLCLAQDRNKSLRNLRICNNGFYHSFASYSSHPVQNLGNPDWYMKWLGILDLLYPTYRSDLRIPPSLCLCQPPSPFLECDRVCVCANILSTPRFCRRRNLLAPEFCWRRNFVDADICLCRNMSVQEFCRCRNFVDTGILSTLNIL